MKKQLHQLVLISLLATCTAPAADVSPAGSLTIKEIDLVHFSHTDVGFTDSPTVCRELYRRYLDIGIDAVLDSARGPADQRFYWTAESTLAVNDWWQVATPARRRQFIKAIKTGQGHRQVSGRHQASRPMGQTFTSLTTAII